MPGKEFDKGCTGLISQFIWAWLLKDDNHWKGDNQFKRICNTDFINGFMLTRYDCRISYHLSLWGLLCSSTEDSWQISHLGSSGCFVLLDVVNCICISFYSQYFAPWCPPRNRFLCTCPVALLQADGFYPSASSAVLESRVSFLKDFA